MKMRYHPEVISRKNTPKKWEIWQADVVCEDNNGHKVRPVVVLKRCGDSYKVLEVTSQSARTAWDVSLHDPYYAGLTKSSVVKCSRIRTISMKSFTRICGILSNEDVASIESLGY